MQSAFSLAYIFFLLKCRQCLQLSASLSCLYILNTHHSPEDTKQIILIYFEIYI